MLNPQGRLKPRAPDVVARAVEGELVVIDAAAGAFFHLNRSAALLWRSLEHGRDVSEAVAELARRHALPPERVRPDVEKLVGRMLEENLLVPAGQGEPPAAGPATEPLPAPADGYEAPRMRVYHLNLYERLKANDGQVASKIIDGEAIMINVATGAYYSLDGAGATIWSLIQAEQSVQTIVDRVAETYGVEPGRVREDLEQLARELLNENLIGILGGPAPGPAPAIGKAQGPYQAPALNVYRDMEQMLALDPPMPTAGEEPAPPVTAPPARDLHLGDVQWRQPR